MSGEQVPQVPPTQTQGLEANLAAALAYLPILAIVWLLVEPYSKNPFIKFHSIQSIALAVVSMGVSIVLTMIPILGWILLAFLPLGVFVVAILCAVKAYQNQKFKLPILGDFAEKQIGG
ncbi:MAG: DUF4870 domain-containing protein [Vicinamibacteria bacterium]